MSIGVKEPIVCSDEIAVEAAVVERSRRFVIPSTMPQTEAALLKFAFEHSSDEMLITDTKGFIRMINDAFVEMFGYPREEVVGQRTGFLRSRYSTQEFYEEMWRSIRERGEWKGEIINRTKHGAEKTCFLTITSVFSET